MSECRDAMEAIGKTRTGRHIGAALKYYLDHGALLSDVHWGNVGVWKGRSRPRAKRFKDNILVITDPGVMIPICKKAESVEIEVI